MRVLVVGGGIGGLSTAIALRQRDVEVDVVEINPRWDVYGVGIIQQSNVVRAINALGLLDSYVAAAFPFDRIEISGKHDNRNMATTARAGSSARYRRSTYSALAIPR